MANEKMIIVRIMGGLGNQMFQYAFYEKLKYLGKNVKVDIRSCYERDTLRKYELDKFPNLDIEVAEEKEIQRYWEQTKKWYNRIIGKVVKKRKKNYLFNELKYKEDIFKIENAYIQGFWQSEKYFLDIQDIIRQRFVFPAIHDEENKKYLEQILGSDSVSIHVRRGDYLSEVNSHIYGNICTFKYYDEAIKYFENKYQDVTFFVFSNDTEWTKKNLIMRKAVIVEGNEEENSIFDMFLMSKCKHNIIANSSFSWWGAWLNQNKDKEVIAPSRWLNTEKVEDIWCEGWMIIDG